MICNFAHYELFLHELHKAMFVFLRKKEYGIETTIFVFIICPYWIRIYLYYSNSHSFIPMNKELTESLIYSNIWHPYDGKLF